MLVEQVARRPAAVAVEAPTREVRIEQTGWRMASFATARSTFSRSRPNE